jgi:hypothetical protein
MKFLEKLKSRKLAKVLSAAAVGGMLLFGNSGDASASPEGMKAFEESYMSVRSDDRVFAQVVSIFGYTVFKADLAADGQVMSNGSMRMRGNANWSYTSPRTKQTLNFNIPFYITQQGRGDVVFYGQNDDGTWTRTMLPGFPAVIANVLKTNDPATLRENMKAVKDVNIFRDDADKRILQVTVSGKYIADLLAKYEAPFSDSPDIDRNLRKAFNEKDLLINWTIDKKVNKTYMAVIELTDVMRAYAQSFLKESAAGVVKLDTAEIELLEAVGYYSEFQYALSYKDDKGSAGDGLTPPAAIAKAPVDPDAFDEIEDDMIAVITKSH